MNRYLIARSGLITTLLLAGLAALALLALFGGRSGARADTSGPNASGYVWIDSNAPDPVVSFEWVDASDGALSAISNADDNYETVTLPFTFNFFGTDYTQVDISSNGFLSFNIGNECNDNYAWGNDDDLGFPIPHGDAACETALDGWGGNPLIAAWFDDLYPSKCGDVYYETVGTAPDQQFVVEYKDVCHQDCDDCEAGEGVTFEVILFEGSNDIKVQYMDTLFTDNPGADPDLVEEDNGQSATTGIDKDDTVGLGYSWTDPLSDNLAVLYTTGSAEGAIQNTASATTDQTNVNADGGSAVLDVTVGAVATPTPAPAQLPRTGGQPGSSSGSLWLVLAIGGLAALAGGAVLTRRFASARR